MLRYSRTASVILITLLAGSSFSNAGDLFFQFRSARSRHSVRRRSPPKSPIPAFDYRTSHAEATTAVTSAGPVPLLTVNPAKNTVLKNSRLFVFPDAQAGPIQLSGLSAKTFPKRGMLLVSGMLIHSGGASGQQKGGKALIRVDALGGVGANTTNRPVVGSREVTCWVYRNEPETVQILLACNKILLTEIERLGRIRLIMEYHPSR